MKKLVRLLYLPLLKTFFRLTFVFAFAHRIGQSSSFVFTFGG